MDYSIFYVDTTWIVAVIFFHYDKKIQVIQVTVEQNNGDTFNKGELQNLLYFMHLLARWK